MILSVAYVISGDLPSVRVHAGEEVDPGGVHEAADLGVPGQVARTQVVSQVQQQLSTQHLTQHDFSVIEGTRSLVQFFFIYSLYAD